MNFCRACKEDFNSAGLFDRHRVGVHAYTFSEGLRMDPPRDDGRRCLSVHEMSGKGWARNMRSRWVDPERGARIAQIKSAERSGA